MLPGQPIRNVAWACDYKSLDKTPVWNLKPLLQATGATLHVIHNDAEQKEMNNTYATGRAKEYKHGLQVFLPLLPY